MLAGICNRLLLGLNLGFCDVTRTCTALWGNELITGTKTSTGICRYTVKYGTAERWAESASATTQVFHGGSFLAGGASAPGLDGSALAELGNVVVVPQFRQGVLGFLPPAVAGAADPNLAVRDVVLFLNEVKNKIGAFGGNKYRVTLGGQSSGASLIRTQWTTPSPSALFHGMIMQSDPMTYGLQSTQTAAAMQSSFFSSENFPECTTIDDFRAIDVNTLIQKQIMFPMVAVQSIPGFPFLWPYRPTFGTRTIPKEPSNALWNDRGSLSINPQQKPLLITTVKDESGAGIFKMPLGDFSGPSFFNYSMILYALVGDRAPAIATSPYYAFSQATTDSRYPVIAAADDSTWRCIARSAANQYASAGGAVYVGEFREGGTYVTNEGNPYCIGRVCHEDDLYVTFGTGGNQVFSSQILQMWSNFMKSGSPDSFWARFQSDTGVTGVKVRALGGDNVGTGWNDSFWGNVVKWDWQIYN